MKSTLGQLWKLGSTSVGELSAGTVKSGTDAADKVFKLAATLEKESENSEQIKQLVEQIPTLLEALNSPWGQVVKSTIPFLGIGTSLLQFAVEATKKEPTLVQSVALVAQSAYLESLRATLDGRTELLEKLEESGSEATQQQIGNLAELELSDAEARFALVYFPQSKLAEAFNNAVISRFTDAEVEEAEARNWAKRIAGNTPRHIEDSLTTTGGEGTKRILEWYKNGGQENFEKYLSIDTYLQEEILTLPKGNVFEEKFTFDDIYVPLKAKFLDENGREIPNADTPLLEDWVKETLNNDEKKQQEVLFIQAAAGRGKSVFCRMFAAWVAQNLHPILTPILIRLRDIEVFEGNCETILRNALTKDFVTNDNGWLTDRNTRFLFILDGFDELRMERGSSGGIKDFIEKVESFQRRSKSDEMGHRVIITGRPLALQGVSLPPNLKRVKLLKMDDELRQQWLNNWQKVVNEDPQVAAKETQAFQKFLEDEQCPEAVQDELAREPLLLYLLARMHRDKDIQLEDLQGSSTTEAKITIYQKCLEAVLREQRKEWLQNQITRLDTETLERILTEAGLCVVQSGGEFAKVKMIESRLETSDSEATQLIKDLRQQQGEKALTSALGAFYLRPAAGDKGGGVEFYHKSFGEFLCAKRLQMSLEEWTVKVNFGRKTQPYIDNQQLCEQIYDLLGYGGLTPEIVEYLIGLLKRSEAFEPVILFERLEDFYWRWCDGEFIDAEGTTLPQQKMRQLKAELPEQASYLGQRQVDVYAGLNVMILLLELHRYAKEQKLNLNFYPCGQPNEEGKLEDPRLLLRLMGYSECLGNYGFLFVMDCFLSSIELSGTDLSGAILIEADLSGANLKKANLIKVILHDTELSGADFSDADLSSADLSVSDLSSGQLTGVDFHYANLNIVNFSEADLLSANLHGANVRNTNFEGAKLNRADLSCADLSGADLRYADLSRANLRKADLTSADLTSADLTSADLTGADLSDAELQNIISWDLWQEGWDKVRGLETAHNIPEAIQQ
ncbi:MAG: hypothetical protein GVY17_00215 [Cyanobacteria bacterium]|jgi:uncharacterized protein YjbI with pentapeptide repeats|nr:hypothetical protein [Cyanobacteria bacterium GSL.Bin21]